MVDFHACSWPHAHLNAEDDSLAQYFDALNDAPIQPLMIHLQQCHQPTHCCSTIAASDQQQLPPSGERDTDAQCAQAHPAADQLEDRAHVDGGGRRHTLHTFLQAADEEAVVCDDSATCRNTCSDPHPVDADAVPHDQSQPRHATERRLPIITFSHFLPLQVGLACHIDQSHYLLD